MIGGVDAGTKRCLPVSLRCARRGGLTQPSCRRLEAVMSDKDKQAADQSGPAPTGQRKPLTPAAERALAEAATRREAIDREAKPKPHENKGREGLDPARYGDWENKGIASDF